MKIGKWIILRRSKIDKIIKLIDGIPDDRELAMEMLGKYKIKQESKFQARIIVKEVKLIAQYSWENSEWKELNTLWYSSKSNTDKDRQIEKLKQELSEKEEELSKPKFQEYTIQIK